MFGIPTYNHSLPEHFNWAHLEKVFIEHDICHKLVYDRWRTVQADDIVVDIGSSVGPFSYTAAMRAAKKIYLIEPSRKLLRASIDNLSEFMIDKKENPYIFINKAIARESGLTLRENKEVKNIYDQDINPVTISFRDLVTEYNISHINFLKIDCEGGEYDIFVDENAEFLKNNVDFIACEFHGRILENGFEKFKKFREFIIKNFSTYYIVSGLEYMINDYFSHDPSMEEVMSKTEPMIYIINR